MSETKGGEDSNGEIIKETLFALEEVEGKNRQHPLHEETSQWPDAAPAVSFFGKGESGASRSPLYDLFQQSIWTSGDDNSGLGDRSNLHKLRGRVLMNGVQSLSNGELLTLVLSTGAGSEEIADRMYELLEKYSFTVLLRMDIGELLKKHRLGEAKASQLLSLLEIARRLNIPQTDEKYQIRSPMDAANLVFPDMSHLDHEEFRVLVLDTKNCVVANVMLYKGTVNSSVVRTAEVFKLAVTRSCPGIIVMHNHPSGKVEPSQEDIEVTKQLIAAGEIFEIELIDHLIIGDHNFLSLREKMGWK